MLARLGERDHAPDQVVDVSRTSASGCRPEDRDRPVRERLAQEGRDRAAVMRAHPRAVRVEDPHDRRVHALLAVVGHRQRLRVALGLVVDAARADRVDVAPVAPRLRMLLRVAVHLARRREQEARACLCAEPERVMGPVEPDLERVQRQPQIVDRRRRRREVVHNVHRLVDEVRLDDVDASVHEVLRNPDVLDVHERPGLQIVDADHAIPRARAARRTDATRGSRRRR